MPNLKNETSSYFMWEEDRMCSRSMIDNGLQVSLGHSAEDKVTLEQRGDNILVNLLILCTWWGCGEPHWAERGPAHCQEEQLE